MIDTSWLLLPAGVSLQLPGLSNVPLRKLLDSEYVAALHRAVLNRFVSSSVCVCVFSIESVACILVNHDATHTHAWD